MAHLNQNCLSPQSLCSYRRLTSMQMGLVEICSNSISHNFGLEGPILQACSACICSNLISHNFGLKGPTTTSQGS